MRTIGKLTALAVKQETRRGMHGDGAGLYLQVAEGGTKSWILRFKRGARTRHLGIGPLHTVSLAEARQRAAEARLMLLDGKDPIEARRRSRSAAAKAVTFDEAAAQYIEAHAPGAADRLEQWRQSIADYASPIIGTTDIRSIDTPDVVRVLTAVWTAKPETASRLRGRIETILDWAKVKGYRAGENNPARWRGHLDHLLPATKKLRAIEHHAALPYAEAPAFMAGLRQLSGARARCLETAILTGARTAEIIGMQWSEINVEKKMWIVSGARMKARREHRVPLPDRVLAILSEMEAIRASEFVFPGRRGRPLGEMSLSHCLHRDMGRSGVTVHGFRSCFRDWAGDRGFPREVAEAALAHVTGDQTERAYVRSDAIERRRKMMDAWSSFCSGERGRVIALSRR